MSYIRSCQLLDLIQKQVDAMDKAIDDFETFVKDGNRFSAIGRLEAIAEITGHLQKNITDMKGLL